MDIVIELNHQGRIWVSAADGTTPEEAWVPGAADTPATLRASGLCPLEEKYTPGTWTSTTLDPQEIASQLWVEASHETEDGRRAESHGRRHAKDKDPASFPVHRP